MSVDKRGVGSGVPSPKKFYQFKFFLNECCLGKCFIVFDFVVLSLLRLALQNIIDNSLITG